MSLYQVQKLFFRINSDADFRAAYLGDPVAAVEKCQLSDTEREAVLAVDLKRLFGMGVDPLLLIPFSQAHGIAPKDYYAALMAKG